MAFISGFKWIFYGFCMDFYMDFYVDFILIFIWIFILIFTLDFMMAFYLDFDLDSLWILYGFSMRICVYAYVHICKDAHMHLCVFFFYNQHGAGAGLQLASRAPTWHCPSQSTCILWPSQWPSRIHAISLGFRVQVKGLGLGGQGKAPGNICIYAYMHICIYTYMHICKYGYRKLYRYT